MKTVKALFFLPLFLSVLALGGCGGGDEVQTKSVFTLDGEAVTGSFDASYSFDVVAGKPYTVSLVETAGATALAVHTTPESAGSPPIGKSAGTPGIYETVSFIADFTGTVYAIPLDVENDRNVTTAFTIEATTNHLTVGAAARTDAVYSSDLFYSFNAEAGSDYDVSVTPTQGTVNITSVILEGGAAPEASSSFTAAETGRYYITVAGTGVDSTFAIRVSVAPAPDLSVMIDSAESDGTNVTINYTVSNIGTLDAADVRVDFWSDATSALAVGSTGDVNESHLSIAAATTVSGTVTIADIVSTGTAYAVVDTKNTVVEGDESNNVSAGVVWQVPPASSGGYGFENGLPTALTMSGNAGWVLDVANTNGATGNTTSLRSGTITHDQESCVAIIVANSSGVSFDLNVSSEAVYDGLRFYIDNTTPPQNFFSGNVAWTNQSYTVANGSHEYKWCYEKDFWDYVITDDAAWIDNIVIN